jgi:hypothetical protein
MKMADQDSGNSAINAKILETGQTSADEEMARRQYEISLWGRDENNALPLYMDYLWMIYANFQVMMVSPFVETIDPPVVINPAYDKETKLYENVYVILDHGYAFSTSRGEESAMGTTAMGKLFNTIQKIIRLIIQRLKEQAGGDGAFNPEDEIKLALFGHELGKRKAFALAMDLEVNINIVNFDPRVWGERFIANLKNMIASGKGYPPDLKHVSERVAPEGGLTQ